MGRKIRWLLVAMLATAGCDSGATQETNGTGAEAPIALHVAEATARSIPKALALDGTLIADEDSNVTPIVGGRVVEVLVELGQRVEEGDPLVRLRDVDYRLQARAARAQLEQARARLGIGDDETVPAPADTPEVRAARAAADLARSNLERSENLARQGALSAQNLEEARNRAAIAEDQYQTALNGTRATLASLTSAQVALSQASSSVGDTTVRAPFAGEIAERMVSVGEYVSPQSPLVTLVRTDPLRVQFQAPQQSLRDVSVGRSVQVHIDAVPDESFDATIRYVSAAVQTNSRGLTAEAVLANPGGLLRPGMFAQIRVDTGTTVDTAVIPARAVLALAGVERVFVIVDGRVEERIITVADRVGEDVLVEDGVSAGEQVAVDHVGGLADGMRVTVEPS